MKKINWKGAALFFLLFSVLGTFLSCSRIAPDELRNEQRGDLLRIVFDTPLRIAAKEKGNDATISFSWQSGDCITLYFKQGERTAQLMHYLGDRDHFVLNQLKEIFSPLPEEIDTKLPFDLYGVVGPAQMIWDEGSDTPRLEMQQSPLRLSLKEVAKDVVLTFERKECSTIDPLQVALTHQGCLFSWGIYAATPTAIKGVKMENSTGDKSYSMLPATEEIPLTSDTRQRLYCWMPLEGEIFQKTKWNLSLLLGTRLWQKLERPIEITKLLRGRHYRMYFDAFDDIAFNVPILSKPIMEWRNFWLSQMPDNMPLFDLLLPSTHDSGANGGIVFTQGWAKCQDLDIAQQLAKGVRGFDVRVKPDGNDLWIYHGIVYMDGNLSGKILDPIVDHLKRFPSEFVVLMHKREGGDTKEYQRLSDEIYARYQSYIYNGTQHNPLRVRDVRGKIILLTRDYVPGFYGKYGFNLSNWGDKETDRMIGIDPYLPSGSSFNAHIQDCYSDVSYATKEKHINNLLDLSEARYRGRKWSINYLSLSSPPTEVWRVASNINPIYIDRLKESKVKYRGLLYMDFAGATGVTRGDELLDAIIEHNFVLSD